MIQTYLQWVEAFKAGKSGPSRTWGDRKTKDQFPKRFLEVWLRFVTAQSGSDYKAGHEYLQDLGGLPVRLITKRLAAEDVREG